MGQDIHAYVEYQEKHGNWTQFAHVRLARWYDLFAFMGTGGSSRRPNITPVIAPRGLPKGGMDIFTKHDYETDERDVGIHHVSWLTHGELQQVQWDYIDWFESKREGVKLPNPKLEDYKAMLAAMEALEASGHMTRLVFWFDN